MSNKLLAFAMLAASLSGAQTALTWLPEHLRPDPFGGITEADRGAQTSEGPRSTPLQLQGARDGYVSCHLLVNVPQGEEFTLRVRGGTLEFDLFREWFHFVPQRKTWIADALVPVSLPYSAAAPDKDNKIPGQRTLAFWLDVWIPKDARPGSHTAAIALETAAGETVLPLTVEVLPAIIPAEDAVIPDHNSYGANWLRGQYPRSADLFELIHAHHRIFYEHRGTFHQLGYGHGGKVAPEFAPALTGSGRSRRIESWDLFDRHYGPLLDGSAFAKTRRGPKPIPFVYLPINPEWPASFLWWGEKGYTAEFVNVVREMEKHFREKQWTQTKFELFFNHKKRYKAFPWDGDETRFSKDDRFFVQYAHLMREAMPDDSPVQWVFRTDSSWTMAEQFKSLSGVIDFWVVSGGMLSLYDWAPELLKARNDILWTYGGTPRATAPSSAITTELLKAWIWGASGYVHWLTVSPGPDPWFQFTGGETALVYPGTHFGIAEPVPSIRLKIQRNCVQDINLLEAAASKGNRRDLAAAVTQRYNGTSPAQWWMRESPLAERPPQEWNNADIGDALRPLRKTTAPSDAASWQRVREYALRVAGGKQ